MRVGQIRRRIHPDSDAARRRFRPGPIRDPPEQIGQVDPLPVQPQLVRFGQRQMMQIIDQPGKADQLVLLGEERLGTDRFAAQLQLFELPPHDRERRAQLVRDDRRRRAE